MQKARAKILQKARARRGCARRCVGGGVGARTVLERFRSVSYSHSEHSLAVDGGRHVGRHVGHVVVRVVQAMSIRSERTRASPSFCVRTRRGQGASPPRFNPAQPCKTCKRPPCKRHSIFEMCDFPRLMCHFPSCNRGKWPISNTKTFSTADACKFCRVAQG